MKSSCTSHVLLTVPLKSYAIFICRMVSAYYCRHISKFIPSRQAFYSFFSTATSILQGPLDDDGNRKREPDFEFLFKSCKKLYHAKCLHSLLLVLGKMESIFLSARLINLYAFLGDISFSRVAFDRMPKKDVYTWNSMVSAYVRSGRFHEATHCFHQFLSTSGLQPDFYTFPPILKACNNLSDGKKIHCSALKLGFEWDVFVASSLIHMYSRFGLVNVSYVLFSKMQIRDMGCWNAMISGFCQNGNAAEAFDVLNQMMLEGKVMDPVTVSSLLAVCAQSDNLLSGKLIHLYVIKHGLELDVFACNALINMYAKFGSLDNALLIFDHMEFRDMVSWNSVISAFEQNGKPKAALEFFKKMQQSGTLLDSLTLVSLASIIAQITDDKKSRTVHGFVLRRGWLMGDVVVGNAVVDMYAKSGAIDSARAVFEGLPVTDVVSWNTMITGYAQNGLASEAVEVYDMMIEYKEIIPNQGTWVSILPAYSHLGAIKQGVKIHALVIKYCLCMDVYVRTCLIDMYGKCGRVDDALSLFYEVPCKSSVSWNAIILCHGIHGHGKQSLKLFKEMLEAHVKPDHVTFVSILTACSHSGLVDEGQRYFHVMEDDYGIRPSVEHYGCMVDLLGRAGHLEAAYNFIKCMPMHPDSSIWGALLGACRIHGNVELGKLASDHLFEVELGDAGYYVLLSNIYANFAKWEGVDKVRSLARDMGLRKTPGWSSIEVENKVDVFYTGNQTHPKCKVIYTKLDDLTAQMKSLGYIPDYSFVLQDVEEDEKEYILTRHSERLAIAYGIISTPPKTTIQIFKNLRICGDCHNATKYISKITEREIIVRDSNRFHHFKDGICSCGDFW